MPARAKAKSKSNQKSAKGAAKVWTMNPFISVENLTVTAEEITRVRDEIHAIIDKIPESQRSAEMGVEALKAFHALLRPDVPIVHGLPVKALSRWNKE